MNAQKIKAANDPKLIKAAIEYHLSESDRLYHEGLYDESRRNRYIVQSLRAQLKNSGFQDPTQATLNDARLQLRTIDMPDDMVRVDPNDNAKTFRNIVGQSNADGGRHCTRRTA